MKAEQYRPNFVTGFKQEQNQFNTTEELLNIDWVKKFAIDTDFHRFSIARDKDEEYAETQHKLMAEYDGGLSWWVVAFIRDEDIRGLSDLPEWEAKRK